MRQLVLFSFLLLGRVFLDISSVTLASSSLGNGNLINCGFVGVCEITDSAFFFSSFSLEHFVWCVGQSFIWQLVLQYQLFLQTLHTNKGGFSLQFKHKWPLGTIHILRKHFFFIPHNVFTNIFLAIFFLIYVLNISKLQHDNFVKM